MSSKRFKRQLYDFMELTGSENEGELWLYGDIVDDEWFDTDVTPKKIKDSLNELGPVKNLNLHINSYGGSCVAGNTIVNLIDNYKRKTGARVIAYIDGIAASMGSGIAMAADYIYMAENAIFMVHKPFSVAIGNADDLAHEKEVLDKVEDTLVANYMRHFNGTEEEMRQLMADESWLTADEAFTYGFCDEVVEPVQVAASAKGIRINGKDFREDKLKGRFKETEEKGSENVFEYDEKLMDYGIYKNTFEKFNASSAEVINMVEKFSDALQDMEISITKGLDYQKDKVCYHVSIFGLSEDGVSTGFLNWNAENVFVDDSIVNPFITRVSAADFLNISEDELTADKLLALAKAGMEIDHDADAKAKAYDKLVSSAIEDAIKSGIRAKGDSFNDTKWKKILAGLDYEEIIDQKNEWEAEAKLVLRAGKRVSQVNNPDNKGDNSSVNVDDYKGL